MRSRYEVSVVIPTFRRQQRLRKLLDSLRNQKFPPEQWEVVVVDDMSGEDFSALLKDYQPFLNLRLIVGTTKGRPAARNAGVSAAFGRHIIFVDDDILVNDVFVESHHRAWRKNRECLIVGKLVAGDSTDSLWTTVVNQRFSHQEKMCAPNPDNIPFAIVATGNLSVGRVDFLALNGFDETTFREFAGEDTDFARRWSASGRRIIYEAQAIASHFEGRISYREFIEDTKYYTTGYIKMFNKDKTLLSKGSHYDTLSVRLGTTHIPNRPTYRELALRIVVTYPLLEIAAMTAQFLWSFVKRPIVVRLAVRIQYFIQIRYFTIAAKKYWVE